MRSLNDPALHHNLPSQATSFVGRAAELAELRSLVSGGSRLVTIAGPGGIGKSRLALQVAEALDSSGDGVWFVLDILSRRAVFKGEAGDLDAAVGRLAGNMGFVELIDADPRHARRHFIDSLDTARITGLKPNVRGALQPTAPR